MKKRYIVLLILCLILTGIFIYKGGHHALYLQNRLDSWLDSADSAQTLEATLNGTPLSADTFWLTAGEKRVIGAEMEGFGIYLRDSILYMRSGIAYTIPESFQGTVERLNTAAVLYGRITKSGSIYRFQMETEAMTVDLSTDADFAQVNFTCKFSHNGKPIEINGVLTQSETRPSLPEAVTNAMVLAEMEPPMPITEVLQPAEIAVKNLLPLRGDLTMGVECGILELSETVEFYCDGQRAEIYRGGVCVSLALPEELKQLPQEALSLLLIHSGEFSREGTNVWFRIGLTPEITAELVTQLVPQASQLGITFESGEAILTIASGKDEELSITAGGSVPFLMTTIPLSFTARLDIQ